MKVAGPVAFVQVKAVVAPAVPMTGAGRPRVACEPSCDHGIDTVGSLSHSQGFLHPRWLFRISEPSTV